MSTAAQQDLTTANSLGTGDFVWYELRTTDAKGAEDFYTHVVGWQTKPSGRPQWRSIYAIFSWRLQCGRTDAAIPRNAWGWDATVVGGFYRGKRRRCLSRRSSEGGRQIALPAAGYSRGRPLGVGQDPQGASLMLFKGSREAPPAPAMGTPVQLVGMSSPLTMEMRRGNSIPKRLGGTKIVRWIWDRWACTGCSITAARGSEA